uniref:Vacuolar protein sorting-associated protein 35 n=1 Tax=Acrobeloides nanus TaxID=290746 RepID=A0A914DM28_9BILA
MTNISISPIIEADQERLLDEALRVVKTESFEMKRCLDRGDRMEGLKHASQMIAELRTSALSPKFYYRLYIDVTNELQHLSSYLTDDYLSENKTTKVAELYELVQYAGNIIPRLYLLITVGVVYFKSHESPKMDILKDLVEMCRGVQHPLRGLFLRYYLLTSTKELLPDLPNNTDVGSGTMNDSIEFIMINFSEMNKLWVRMQHQGPSREREKREKERRELRILVGTNLVRLSQLEHLDIELYRKVVLPGVLEQSVSCKEPISQEYLMECVIQVFPDEFHLATLNEFLDSCAELSDGVHIKNVLGALIDRLAIYAVAEESPGIPADIQLFEVFSRHAERVIGSRSSMPPEDIIAIQTALINLAVKCYPDRTDFANTVFESTNNIFQTIKIEKIPFNNNVGRELLKLLRIPVDHYNDVIKLLELSEYAPVLSALGYRGRTQAASYIVQNMLDNDTAITDENHVEKVFKIIDALLIDQPDQPQELESSEDFQEEQNLVARLVNLVYNENLDQHFRLLNKIRKSFGNGGKLRLRYTLPPVIFSAYKLLLRFAHEKDLENWEAKVNKIFHFCMNTINALKSEADLNEIGLRFYLQGAIVADKIPFENSPTVSYEFISNAFSIYEEEISESREQVQALTLLIGTIQQMKHLPDESHDPLRNQCALCATKLLKKPDQARLVCLVAHLFWYSTIADSSESMKDGKRVAECLKKAIKIASQCMEDLVQINLYIHILNNYIHFFDQGCEQITYDIINQLVDKTKDSLLQLDPSPDLDLLNESFSGTLSHLRYLKSSNADSSRYDGIAI